MNRPCAAAKVWCPDDEPEPEGLFNKATCPDAPPHWFAEDPGYAAELYGLERGLVTLGGPSKEYNVHVIDGRGVLYKFKVKVGHELTAHVRAA